MSVTVYKSTDESAPTLNNVAGSLVTVFDAILVNGYGAKSSQGWSIAYSDTNKRVYRQPVGSNQFYLRVDDTGTTTARVRGWEVKADINDAVDESNTGPFPTDAQQSGGMYINKSSSGTRAWFAYGNGNILYFFAQYAGDANLQLGFCFGDITTFKSGDVYHTIIIGSLAANASVFGLKGTQVTGIYLARSYTQAGGSYLSGMQTTLLANSVYLGYTGIPYPNPEDGCLYISPCYIVEASNTLRGIMPGMWEMQHAKTSFTNEDIFSGIGDLSGKTFEIIKLRSSTDYCAVAMETSDTW